MSRNQYVCRIDDSVLACAEKVLQNKDRILFVEDDEKRIVGVLTEGDLVRALGQGSLVRHSPIQNWMTKSFFFVREFNEGMDPVTVFTTLGHLAYPVLNGEQHLVDIRTLRDFLQKSELG